MFPARLGIGRGSLQLGAAETATASPYASAAASASAGATSHQKDNGQESAGARA